MMWTFVCIFGVCLIYFIATIAAAIMFSGNRKTRKFRMLLGFLWPISLFCLAMHALVISIQETFKRKREQWIISY